MQNLKNKTLAITIALFLTLSMSASMVLTPRASAAPAPLNIQLFAFCNVGTNPDGINQPVNIGFWLNEPTPTATGPYGDRWTGFMVTVTLPDGTTAKLGPFTADDTGGTHDQYTPTELGTYSFQMSFPGQTLLGTNPPPTGYASTITQYIGDYYLPATSNVATMTVQQQPVGGVSVAPLPSSYWQTPINAMNVNNWYVLGGASLFTNGYSTSGGGMYNISSNYNPYTLAPMTAHIMWTTPEAFGGVLGGQYGGTTTYGNYYSTSQYEKKFDQIVMNGYLYYTEFPGSSTNPAANICVSLYTGKIVWIDNAANFGGGSPEQTALTTTGIVTDLVYGQLLDFVSPNQYGGLAYLWTTGAVAGIANSGTEFNMFDAETGQYILSVVNGTSMSMTFDQSGDLIGYYINETTSGTQTLISNLGGNLVGTPVVSTGPMLQEWNSTLCVQNGAWSAQASGWYWRPPQDGIIPFADGLEWVMPLATNISGVAIPAYTYAPGGIRAISGNDVVCAAYPSAGANYFQPGYGIFSAYSMATGQQLWVENITLVPFTEDGNTGGGTAVGDGVWTIPSHQNGVIQGYSLATGGLLWTTNLAPFDPYDSIGGYFANVAGSTLYLAGFGGDIWSINILTGAINWYTNTTDLQGPSGTNSPYGIWPLWGFAQGGIADGLLFLAEGHEYSPPLFLGAQQLALNCTTGQLVWSIDAFDIDSHPVIAYGILTTLNAYDNQIYAYGMGPSKTTVNAPSIGVTTATPVTITGTVMDISAGSQQAAVAADFPNGLPCVSDASMSQFMESVFMQQPMPTNITGVPVTISVTDSNGNCYNIGTTTTDPSGFFSYSWTPTITGNYTVTATFAGSQSYYGSYANAAFYASAPASPAPSSSPVSLASTQSDIMGIGIAIIVIIIVGIAVLAVLMLRKRS